MPICILQKALKTSLICKLTNVLNVFVLNQKIAKNLKIIK